VEIITSMIFIQIRWYSWEPCWKEVVCFWT